MRLNTIIAACAALQATVAFAQQFSPVPGQFFRIASCSSSMTREGSLNPLTLEVASNNGVGLDQFRATGQLFILGPVSPQPFSLPITMAGKIKGMRAEKDVNGETYCILKAEGTFKIGANTGEIVAITLNPEMASVSVRGKNTRHVAVNCDMSGLTRSGLFALCQGTK